MCDCLIDSLAGCRWNFSISKPVSTVIHTDELVRVNRSGCKRCVKLPEKIIRSKIEIESIVCLVWYGAHRASCCGTTSRGKNDLFPFICSSSFIKLVVHEREGLV